VGEINVASVAKSLIGTAVSLVGSFTVGQRVFYLIRLLRHGGLIADLTILKKMIVAMAVTTTTAMPPIVSWGLSRVPLCKAELT
jgi:hypothetical protein